MLYTYAHYKPDGTIFYIGKGSYARAFTKNSRSQHWKNTVAKHGGYTVQILAPWNTEKQALDHEIFLIDTFKQLGFVLVNKTFGGEGIKGLKHSEESKKKMSEAAKKRIPTQSQLDALARNRHLAWTKEAQEKKSQSLSGKTRTEEQRLNISAGRKGKNLGVKQSAEHIAKRCETRKQNQQREA